MIYHKLLAFLGITPLQDVSSLLPWGQLLNYGALGIFAVWLMKRQEQQQVRMEKLITSDQSSRIQLANALGELTHVLRGRPCLMEDDRAIGQIVAAASRVKDSKPLGEPWNED